ncbi:DUF7344 domain-containing protein [Natrononativus amylolyticus]|uniref:DUF7344 domain-containing protein n=1 Tax=Natrononativus amylolyticus TaxID=2963434 RepID=UPI0020CBD484|nr:hypothetical protein [Natrononativus amylolyticus]
MGGDEHSGDDRPPHGDSHDRDRGADSMDELFTALRNRDRRYALYFLLEHRTVSVDELADVVAGWTRATAYGMASRRVRDHVLLTLRHRHVPALVEAGLVRTENGTVSLEALSPTTRAFIDRACAVETGVAHG